MPSSNHPINPGAEPHRPTVAAGTLWAGGLATAFVAALAYAVGIVIVRVLFDIPVLAPERDGALGDATTWQLAMTAFGAAVLATALMHLLLVATPRPYTFFAWILGLLTALATVLPFAREAPVASQIATAVINLVVGAAIAGLLRGVAARSVRRGPYDHHAGNRPPASGPLRSDPYRPR